MARNRKHQTVAVRFGPALKAFLLCVLIGGSGVGYVWQKSQIDDLSKQRKQREKRLIELQDSNKKLSNQLATMQSAPQLDLLVKKLNLGLGPAAPGQIMRLIEPSADPLPPRGATQFAARQNASEPMP